MKFQIRETYDRQLLYFTSSSCLQDGSGLVFIGEQDGCPNIYYRSFVTGETRQLSDNREGTLKSYVYFNTVPDRGLGKASVCLDGVRGLVYYLQGRSVCRADLEGHVTVLAQIPEGQVSAFMHVSADGSRLCVPTTDARALEDALHPGPVTRRPDFDIDARVLQENLCSYLRVYDTGSGAELLCERVPKAWITHVQFHPQNRDWILYNHEWPCFYSGFRRMWLWDGRCHRALRSIDKGRSPHDWVCHEMWSEDGSEIVYHGQYDGGRYFVGRLIPETGTITEIALPPDYCSYGHFTISRDGLLVSDGYYCQPEDAPSPGRWISVQRVDWERGEIRWFPLERHNSSWATQDEHPHPIFSPDGRRVYYTTDADGRREIRSCPVPPEALEAKE